MKTEAYRGRATVSEKGQVTIPKRLRDRLGIRPGQVMEFEEDAGRLIGCKADALDALDALFGAFPMDETTDEFIEAIRGPVDTV
ncbi:MAG: AbrB/MazE/SpoVT family DNA-binding domain-containing protein [Tepidiformaceae bacterium]